MWRHDHRFELGHEGSGERRAWVVVGLTAAMMLAEIAAGIAFNSMALLADGWHMATHAGALTLAGLAYVFQRRHADNPDFAFGTGKVGSLAGFASAVALGIVALLMVWESGLRLIHPTPIAFGQALLVAAIGLGVNLVCAWLLGNVRSGERHDDRHDQAQPGRHGHEHHHVDHHGHDHNLRGAYLHVLADAFTSVTAIMALLSGMLIGWGWMDPAMGILGAGVILYWSRGLLRESGAALLDRGADPELAEGIKAAIEADADNKVVDLHIWRLAPAHDAAIVSLVTHNPRPPAHYKALVSKVRQFSHLTIEVNSRADKPAAIDQEGSRG